MDRPTSSLDAALTLAAAGADFLEAAGHGDGDHARSLRSLRREDLRDGSPRRVLTPRRDLLQTVEVDDLPIVDAMLAVDPHATWAEYDASEWAAGCHGKMAAAFVVGPTAPIVASDVAFGMFVVAPGCNYPEHGHPAREVYAVVAGETEFLGVDGWRTLRAGDVSVQEPEVAHALRTTHQPMLCFWAWTGDITSPIWALDDAGERFYPYRRDQ